MQLQILLIILTSLFIQAFAIDLIEEGRKVIIQRDVEHILVKLNLKNTLDTLNSIGKSIFMAKRTLASNTLDFKEKGIRDSGRHLVLGDRCAQRS